MGVLKVNIGTLASPTWIPVGNGGTSLIVTSATRPSSPGAGQIITETDTGQSYVWTGTTWWNLAGGAEAWTDFTPTVGGSPTYAGGAGLRARYKRIGNTVTATYFLQGGLGSSFATSPNFTVPFSSAAATSLGMRWCGVAFMSKSGNPNWVSGTVNLNAGSDTPSIAWLNDALTGDLNGWTATTPDTLAGIAYATWTITYECA